MIEEKKALVKKCFISTNKNVNHSAHFFTTWWRSFKRQIVKNSTEKFKTLNIYTLYIGTVLKMIYIYIKNAIKIQSIIYIYRSACMYISIYISTHHHTHPCYINVLCVLNFKWILGAKISPFLRKIYTTCLLP